MKNNDEGMSTIKIGCRVCIPDKIVTITQLMLDFEKYGNYL